MTNHNVDLSESVDSEPEQFIDLFWVSDISDFGHGVSIGGQFDEKPYNG